MIPVLTRPPDVVCAAAAVDIGALDRSPKRDVVDFATEPRSYTNRPPSLNSGVEDSAG